MEAGLVGFMIGTIAASLVIPIILLVILKAIPATKNKHGVNYGIAGAIGVFIAFVALGDRSVGLAVVAALIIAGLFYWQYKSAVAKAAIPKST